MIWPRLFPMRESCHAKCSFSAAGEPDREDYVRCLELSRAAGFSGPYTLIYNSASVDEWNGLTVEAQDGAAVFELNELWRCLRGKSYRGRRLKRADPKLVSCP